VKLKIPTVLLLILVWIVCFFLCTFDIKGALYLTFYFKIYKNN